MPKPIVPGINPKLITTRFTDNENRIIKRLAQEWQITHGGKEIVLSSKSKYRYFLMKPVSHFREMFNLEREIVVLFSPYLNFDTRTLDAIKRAFELYPVLRIDPICSVLISNDPRIETKLRDLIASDPESRIIVPFTYEELLSPAEPYFLRNRFKAHFYTRDIFAFEAPLRTDLYFFGRTDLIHRLVNRYKSNENSGLFGLRKTGKTSVIFAVQRALAKIRGASLVIDCQNTAFHRRRWNAALHYITSELVKYYQLDITITDEDSYTEENASLFFERDICAIHKQLDNKNILLIFDEVETITFGISPSKHWAEESDFVYFWQTIRSLFQKLDNVFTFLIVGTNPLCIEAPKMGSADNPIFSLVPFEYVPKFDVPQTREMIRKIGRIMGLQFDELIYGKLTEDFGGHPFLMRHVCSVINQISQADRPVRVYRSTYEKAKNIFYRDYSRYIEMILNVLREFYGDEFTMLEYLARGDTRAFNQWSEISPYYTSHLLGYGIVQKEQEEYAFGIEAVQQYLSATQKYKKLDLTSEEIFAEVSQRRNELEPKLRYIIRSQLRATYGASVAKEKVLVVLGGVRRARYNAVSYEDVFDTTKSKIYFEDLRKLVMKYWDCFQHIFGPDKDEFNQRMKTINKYRIDAHAAGLNMEKMAYLRICFTAIEKCVEEFLNY